MKEKPFQLRRPTLRLAVLFLFVSFIAAASAGAQDADNDGLLDAADPCPAEARNLCYGPVAIDGSSGNPIRLNANAISGECQGTRVDCNGDTWLADFAYNQAGNGAVCSLDGGCPIAGIDTIFGCNDAATEDLFQCEHWDPSAAPALIYDFDVADGNYLVNLLFAATYKSSTAGPETVGSRVFDILVEGVVAYDDFDQVAATGGTAAGVAVVRSVMVAVSDGNGLQVEFAHVTDNPAIKAIEVLEGPLSCVDAGDCNDGNDCTFDSCVNNLCQNDAAPLEGGACDDGLFCTATDTCTAGVCGGTGDPCAAGGQCDDTCDEAADACNLPAGTACDADADACTIDQCDGAGSCAFVQTNTCDDGNACTTDLCAAGSCSNLPVLDGSACDDGLFCTATDTCTSGVCGGTGDPCAAGGQCNDACDEAGDTCNLPAGAACDLDADLCTVDTCDGAGGCVFSTTVGCQAADQCDGGEQCNPSTGACDALPDVAAGTPCDDGAACSTPDTCDGAGQCAGTDACTGGLECNLVNGQCEIPAGDPDNDGLFDAADPCPLDARNLCYGPVAVDTTTGNEIRLNANAIVGASCQGTRVDCNGDTWLADFGWNQQGNGAECNLDGGCPIASIDAIFGCSDDATEDLFQCEHWDPSTAPDLAYDFAVADGNYVVNLLFASTYKSATTGPEVPGDRVFDILIEGALAYDDFDHVVAAGGSGIAVVRSAVVSVSDGNGLQIAFGHEDDNPALKGIEVLYEATPCIVVGDCDDQNTCTIDACVDGFCQYDTATNEGQACDDGLFCTVIDACVAGVCTGFGDPCASGSQCADTCDEAADSCDSPAGTACDIDADLCTVDQCDGAGVCLYASDVVCQAADACEGGAVCNSSTGACEALADAPAGAPCNNDADLCTIDECDGAGGCVFADNVDCTPTQCEAGGTCTPATGSCDGPADPAAGTPCDLDGDLCTIDVCDGAGSCGYDSDVVCTTATECDGGSTCNQSTGACDDFPDPPAGTACTDDGNVCTDNECDGIGACAATANSNACDDGLYCNGLDFCGDGACTLHTGSPCSSSESCDEATDVCSAEECMAMALPDPVHCFTGRDCTIPVDMQAGSLAVASVYGALTSGLAIDCSSSCTPGPSATNAVCATDPSDCSTIVADIETPIDTFADGVVAELSIQCIEPGIDQLCLTDQSAGLVDGTPIDSCGEDCVSFECTACLSGDCNMSGAIDAGDPICSVLCLIGQAPPGADCTCAADCNCLGGTEAGDPICSVLRLIDDFSPDTCSQGGGGGAFVVERHVGPADTEITVRVPRSRTTPRAKRVKVRLVGEDARLVAGTHVTFAADGRIGRVKLAGRLKDAGFSATVRKSGRGHAAVVITPPLGASGVAAIGEGRLLRIRLPRSTETIELSTSSLGSIDGLPLEAR